MRIDEPKELKDWRKLYESWPPRCCHTCENYTHNGVCTIYQQEPTEYYANLRDWCEHWSDELIPF